MRFALALIALLFSSQVKAETIVRNSDELRHAVANAPDDTTITIATGVYDIADLKIRRDLTLVGENGAVLTSSRAVAKGLLNPLPGVSLHVSNLKFRGAKSPDKNGAGIRHDGADLTVVNCIFVENENGILSTGDETGRVRIHGSQFLRSGHGDGYSHGIYVLRAASLTIENSGFTGTKIGHHVKSLAAHTLVQNSTLDDGDGRTSYAVDASKGGDVTIAGNTIIQAVDGDNATIINYDLSRGGAARALKIVNNRILNYRTGGRLLRNETRLRPSISGNAVENFSGASLAIRQEEQYGRLPAAALVREAKLPLGSMEKPPAHSAAPPRLEERFVEEPQRRGLIDAPVFDRSEAALAYFKLMNVAGTQSSTNFVTFGQAFAPNALRPDQKLIAIIGQRPFPSQLDVKALHDDGSVRHGVVTIKAPAPPKGESISGKLILASTENSAERHFNAADIIAQKFSLPFFLLFYFSNETHEDVSGNLFAEAQRAFSTKTDGWLDGPFVEERRIERELTDHLRLRADIRVYADGAIRTSLAFINDKSFSPGRRDAVYDVLIGDQDDPALKAERIPHHRAANWRRIFWSGAQHNLHIIHDTDGLVASGGILPVDLSFGVSADAIAVSADQLHEELPPMSPALIQRYMPTTGGRDDIGVVPTWTAQYLVTQTSTAKDVMLTNADAAGAIPWHFADDKTGAPISIEDNPDFWADSRGVEETTQAGRPNADIFKSSSGGWTIDHAHKPALTAIPWLVTGDRYYADELAMQGSWAVFGQSPLRRNGVLKSIDIGEVRESAWSLRDLSDASFLLPDDHPSKGYLTRVLTKNLAMMSEKYVAQRAMKAAGELEGYIEEPLSREPEDISPWQNDFLAVSLWLAARRGFDDAKTILAWSENFHVGRIMHPDFDRSFAAAYHLPAKREDGATPVAYWSELLDKMKTEPMKHGAGFVGHKDLADGYIGLLGASLTATGSANGNPAILDALRVWLRETKPYQFWSPRARNGVARRNGFLFRFTGPNMAHYEYGQIIWSGKGGDGDDLVVGHRRHSTLNGGKGKDLLLGGANSEMLTGGDGDDYLNSGGGDDRMAGGEGGDIFAISGLKDGRIVIEDFDPSKDRIYLGAALLRANATHSALFSDDASGALLETENPDVSVTLLGVRASQLSRENIRKFDKNFTK